MPEQEQAITHEFLVHHHGERIWVDVLVKKRGRRTVTIAYHPLIRRKGTLVSNPGLTFYRTLSAREQETRFREKQGGGNTCTP